MALRRMSITLIPEILGMAVLALIIWFAFLMADVVLGITNVFLSISGIIDASNASDGVLLFVGAAGLVAYLYYISVLPSLTWACLAFHLSFAMLFIALILKGA